MADIITRCPKCATAFRITDTLLTPPRGRVRCGACLHVFNASEHVVDSLAAATASTPNATPDLAKAENTPAQEKPESHSEALEDDDDEVSEDESWALELLKDDAEPPVTFRKIVVNAPQGRAPRPKQPTPKPPKDAMLDELDALLGAKGAPKSNAKTTEQLAAPSAAATVEPPADRPAPQPKPVPPTQTAPEPTPPPLITDQLSLEEMMAAIQPEALEVEWQPVAPAWRRRILWPALAILALLLLLAQVAWLEFPRLNKIEPYRTLYIAACEYIGCTVPALQDVSQIRTSNLLVRTHPELEDTLLVDVILHNTAPFEQSFPDLQLTFSSARNRAVAVRRFTPEEYLGGELAGSNVMPVNNPIHIALEVEDPGPEAVSYSISIVE